MLVYNQEKKPIISRYGLRNENLIRPENLTPNFAFTAVSGKWEHSKLRDFFSSAAVEPKGKSGFDDY